MKEKTALVVGAGKEGKGFLGESFSAAGWHLYFLDKDEKVIENLNKGSYRVKLHKTDSTVIRTIKDYTAYLCDEKVSCQQAVNDADLITLCLYPEDIPDAAHYLGDALTVRAASNEKPLTIISCTNKNHIINNITQWFRDGLKNEAAKEWFDRNVVVRDAIVRRSTDAKTNYDLDVETIVIAPLLVQGPINVDVSDLDQIELTDDLEQLKEIKLYTINAPHATCAYAGYLKGYKTIPEAEKDPAIAGLMKKVVTQSIHALSKEYNIDEERLWSFATLAIPLEEMADEIFRVCLDPVRKLSKNDRLTGNVLFCWKHNVDPDPFYRSIANAMMYTESRDEKAVYIQKLRAEKGDIEAIAQICGVANDSPLVVQVSAYMKEIEKSGQPMV